MKKILFFALSLFISASYAAENYEEYKLVFSVRPEKRSTRVVKELYDFISPFKGIHAEFCHVLRREPDGEYWERDGVRVTAHLSRVPLYTSIAQESEPYKNSELALPSTITIKWQATSEQAAYNMAQEAVLSLNETKQYMQGAYLSKKGEHGQWHTHYLDLETGLTFQIAEQQENNE